MHEVKRYICGVCRKDHRTAQEALECESSHKFRGDISISHSWYEKGKELPPYITIEEGNKSARYVLADYEVNRPTTASGRASKYDKVYYTLIFKPLIAILKMYNLIDEDMRVSSNFENYLAWGISDFFEKANMKFDEDILQYYVDNGICPDDIKRRLVEFIAGVESGEIGYFEEEDDED